MTTEKITKRSVDALTPGTKDKYLWHDGGDLRGFGVKCTPAGRKVFLVQYKVDGRTRRYTIGKYGPLTVFSATKQAKRVIAEIALGTDPMEKKTSEQMGRSVAALFEIFFEENTKTQWKHRTAQEYRSLYDRFIRPAIGRRKACEIKQIDISRLHRSLCDTPRQADHMRALLSKFFNWLEFEEVRPINSNPVKNVRRLDKSAGRERFLTTEEMQRLGRALVHFEQSRPQLVALVRLLIFTGARLSEIATLKWEYVDMGAAVLSLPDSKTGRKRIYLPAPALQLLANTVRVEGNPYVLPGKKAGGHYRGAQKGWQQLRRFAGLEDVRMHDLRHSYASIAAAGGVPLQMVGALLGHADVKTTQRYSHLADTPVRRAADRISGEIHAALAGRVGELVSLNKERPEAQR